MQKTVKLDKMSAQFGHAMTQLNELVQSKAQLRGVLYDQVARTDAAQAAVGETRAELAGQLARLAADFRQEEAQRLVAVEGQHKAESARDALQAQLDALQGQLNSLVGF